MRVVSIDIGAVNFAFYVEDFDPESLENLKTERLPQGRKYRFDPRDGMPLPVFGGFLDRVYRVGTRVSMGVFDLTERGTIEDKNDPRVMLNMFHVLADYWEIFDSCDVVLIERQMEGWGGGGRRKGGRKETAIKNVCLGQNCASWFLMKYGVTKPIIKFPALYKFSMLGCPVVFEGTKISPYRRKRWSALNAMRVLQVRGDDEGARILAPKERGKRPALPDAIPDTPVGSKAERLMHHRKLDDIGDCIGQLQAYKLMVFVDERLRIDGTARCD